jgi:hypothetical protein
VGKADYGACSFVYLLVTGSLSGVQFSLAIGYASCGTLALAAISKSLIQTSMSLSETNKMLKWARLPWSRDSLHR